MECETNRRGQRLEIEGEKWMFKTCSNNLFFLKLVRGSNGAEQAFECSRATCLFLQQLHHQLHFNTETSGKYVPFLKNEDMVL